MYLLCNHQGQQIQAVLDAEHPQVIIGRHRDCDMVVKNPRMSRRHCQVRWTQEGVTIKDLGSSAGTFVGDRKVGRSRIKPGDVIRLADLPLELHDGDAPAQSAPVPTLPSREEAVPAVSAEPSWELHYDAEDGTRQVLHLRSGDKSAVLGRKDDCDIRLVNPTVGRHHCRVTLTGGSLRADDLESSNGTFINEKKIRSGALSDGDVLACGTAEITIRRGDAPAEDDYSNDTWHEIPMEAEVGPPNWFLVYTDGDGRINSLEMAMKVRVLAVGSDKACEICVPDQNLEDEHIEVTWEHGVLVVRDLGTATGTLLNGRTIDEVVLRNGDVITCGDFQLHVVRGSSGEVGRASTGTRSQEADFWAPLLARHDDGLSLTYIDTDPYDDTRKRELTLWGDGETTVELVSRGQKTTTNALVASVTLDALGDALVRAGFPDSPSELLDADEDPAELEVYLDNEGASVTLNRRVMERSAVYKEVTHLLAAILAQARG